MPLLLALQFVVSWLHGRVSSVKIISFWFGSVSEMKFNWIGLANVERHRTRPFLPTFGPKSALAWRR